jgi:aspartate aminotransferase-like enzyme
MFVPGPVDVDPEVLVAQAQPMIPHRGKEFEGIFQRASDKARGLFYTQYRVFVVTASAAVVRKRCCNLMDRLTWSTVLFSAGMMWRLQWKGGYGGMTEQPILPEMVAEALKKQKYDAITRP